MLGGGGRDEGRRIYSVFAQFIFLDRSHGHSCKNRDLAQTSSVTPRRQLKENAALIAEIWVRRGLSGTRHHRSDRDVWSRGNSRGLATGAIGFTSSSYSLRRRPRNGASRLSFLDRNFSGISLRRCRMQPLHLFKGEGCRCTPRNPGPRGTQVRFRLPNNCRNGLLL
jgi:hypothetical protein